MKSYILCLVAFMSSNLFADTRAMFTSFDLEMIGQKLESSASGTNANFELSNTTASCRVNNLSQLPGFSCFLVSSTYSLTLTHEDIESLNRTMSETSSGVTKDLRTQSQDTISCRSNSMAELVGYKCDLKF